MAALFAKINVWKTNLRKASSTSQIKKGFLIVKVTRVYRRRSGSISSVDADVLLELKPAQKYPPGHMRYVGTIPLEKHFTFYAGGEGRGGHGWHYTYLEPVKGRPRKVCYNIFKVIFNSQLVSY